MPRAIDFHVHLANPETAAMLAGEPAELRAFFRSDVLMESLEATAERYRALDPLAVLRNADGETTPGIPPIPNDHIAEAVRRWPDTFVGFAGIDPWKGLEAVAEVERSLTELGLA